MLSNRLEAGGWRLELETETARRAFLPQPPASSLLPL